jgi:hypothetical protein
VQMGTNAPTGRGRQSLSMSRGPAPNSNQCIRVGTDRDKGVWQFEAATRDGRSAQIAAVPRRLGEPGQIDPNAVNARPTEPRTATPI